MSFEEDAIEEAIGEASVAESIAEDLSVGDHSDQGDGSANDNKVVLNPATVQVPAASEVKEPVVDPHSSVVPSEVYSDSFVEESQDKVSLSMTPKRSAGAEVAPDHKKEQDLGPPSAGVAHESLVASEVYSESFVDDVDVSGVSESKLKLVSDAYSDSFIAENQSTAKDQAVVDQAVDQPGGASQDYGFDTFESLGSVNNDLDRESQQEHVDVPQQTFVNQQPEEESNKPTQQQAQGGDLETSRSIDLDISEEISGSIDISVSHSPSQGQQEDLNSKADLALENEPAASLPAAQSMEEKVSPKQAGDVEEGWQVTDEPESAAQPEKDTVTDAMPMSAPAVEQPRALSAKQKAEQVATISEAIFVDLLKDITSSLGEAGIRDVKQISVASKKSRSAAAASVEPSSAKSSSPASPLPANQVLQQSVSTASEAVSYAAKLLTAIPDEKLQNLEPLDLQHIFLTTERQQYPNSKENQQIFHKLIFDVVNSEIANAAEGYKRQNRQSLGLGTNTRYGVRPEVKANQVAALRTKILDRVAELSAIGQAGETASQTDTDQALLENLVNEELETMEQSWLRYEEEEDIVTMAVVDALFEDVMEDLLADLIQ